MKRTIFTLIALSSVLIGYLIYSKAQEYYARQERIKECEVLSKEGEIYHYAEGKLTLLKDIPVARPVNPFPSGDIRGKKYNDTLSHEHEFKGYFAKFSIVGLNIDEAIIRGTNRFFSETSFPLEKGNNYGFCYTIEKQKRIAVNHPETIKLID